MRNKKGFTLIELLVVIAIIGLLSTLAVVSLNGARQKARDAKRKSDLNSIATAMEMYKANGTDDYYPVAGTCGNAGIIASGSAVCSTTPLVDSSGFRFLEQIPGDPQGTSYTYAGSNATYTITATLENPAGTFTCTNGSCR